jgi:hypothetical protein
VQVSHDGGASWFTPATAPTGMGRVPFWWPLSLAVDHNAPGGAAGTFFYLRNNFSAPYSQLWRSVDDGGSWQLVNGSLDGSWQDLYTVATPFAGTSSYGDLWLSFAEWGTGGVWHSVDGGATLQRTPTPAYTARTLALGPLPGGSLTCPDGSAHTMASLVQRCNARAGVAAAAGSYAVYIYGQAGNWTGMNRVLASVDQGATWISLAQEGQALGDGPYTLSASEGAPGTVFVGTDGRGVFYADATPALVEAVAQCAGSAALLACSWGL